MNRVDVRPELIRWALERSGLTDQALHKKFPKLHEWLDRATSPTLRQLEGLSRATMTPLGYFFLPEPPEDKLPIPDFRTVSDTPVMRPSPNLLETVQIMQRRQEWMREYIVELGEDPLQFIHSATFQDDPNEVAAGIRMVLGLQEQWARDKRTWEDALRALRDAADESGILVVLNGVVGNNTHRKLDVDEFRGFVLCDEYAPLVFVNGADAKAAQMFTLAHELAHLWLGTEGVFNLRELQPANNKTEIFCNHVAAEFLVPAADIRAFWTKAELADEPFQYLARQFKVSPIVAARRALDLHLISRDQFFEFYHAYEEDDRRQRRKSAGGDFYATQLARVGKRFAETVFRATKEGRLLYRDAYELTGLHGKSFDSFGESIGALL